jgi:hypothetical protein
LADVEEHIELLLLLAVQDLVAESLSIPAEEDIWKVKPIFDEHFGVEAVPRAFQVYFE